MKFPVKYSLEICEQIRKKNCIFSALLKKSYFKTLFFLCSTLLKVTMKNENDGNVENCSCSNLLKKHLKEHLIAQSRDIKKCNQNPVERLRWSLFRNS